MRKTLAVVALFFLVPLAFAGDEPPDPKAIAEAYVGDEPALRAEAEKVVAAAGPELLRQIAAELREMAQSATHELVFAPAPAPPPGAMPAPRPAEASCGGGDLDVPPLEAPDLPAPPPGSAVSNAPLVNVEVRFLHVSEVAAARLGLAGDAPAASRDLTPEQVEQIVTAVEKDSDAAQMSAPKITVYDRQRATVSIVNQISYIQDYDVEVSMGATSVANPVVGTVQEGLVVVLRPAASADRKSILFDVSFTVAELVRPIPVWKTKLGGTEVQIQLPELRVLKRTQRAVVVPGRTVVLDTWPQIEHVTEGDRTTDRRRVGIALLKAELIDAADLTPTNFVPPEPKREDSIPKPPR